VAATNEEVLAPDGKKHVGGGGNEADDLRIHVGKIGSGSERSAGGSENRGVAHRPVQSPIFTLGAAIGPKH
jgi:hypothetical protein